jgi:hypothetical protein
MLHVPTPVPGNDTHPPLFCPVPPVQPLNVAPHVAASPLIVQLYPRKISYPETFWGDASAVPTSTISGALAKERFRTFSENVIGNFPPPGRQELNCSPCGCRNVRLCCHQTNYPRQDAEGCTGCTWFPFLHMCSACSTPRWSSSESTQTSLWQCSSRHFPVASPAAFLLPTWRSASIRFRGHLLVC